MKKKGIIVMIVVIIGAVAAWKRDWIKEQLNKLRRKPAENDSSGKYDDQKQENIDYTEQDIPPFKLGSKGRRVESIQKALNLLYESGLQVDGYFGRKTESALLENGYSKVVETKDILQLTKLLKERKQ